MNASLVSIGLRSDGVAVAARVEGIRDPTAKVASPRRLRGPDSGAEGGPMAMPPRKDAPQEVVGNIPVRASLRKESVRERCLRDDLRPASGP